MTSRRSLLSVCDRYRPTVELFLAHVDELRASSRWDESFRQARVERVRAVAGGFELDGHGVFRHVLLAPGHPGLARPAELEGDPRAVHAYEPHEYASRVAIVGAGMAAATEWLNALAAGAEVVSVRRREPARRPLNVARPFFTKRGLAGFRAAPRARRAELLRGFGEPSYPPGRSWDAPLEQAAREGRFRVERELNGAEQVICATGFRHGFEHDPLLAGLVAEHGLETEERWIVLADDSTVPALTDSTRTLSLAGVPAQWAFPAADTLVGMKIAARASGRESSDVLHAERPDRDAARRGAAPVPRRRRALADPAQVVAARAGRADARDRARARRGGLPPPAPLPAGLACAPARPARARG